MAIGVKTVRRPESETSYLRATLRGMALTFRHLIDTDKKTTSSNWRDRDVADTKDTATQSLS